MTKNCFKKKQIWHVHVQISYLPFGETTSHLTSKWRGIFQYFLKMLEIAYNAKKNFNFFLISQKKNSSKNVGKSIKRLILH